MARGEGSSLGRALVNALADAAGGSVGVRRTYTATGWHAQLSKLTSQPRGYQAAAKVGLSATERTLKDWLAERVTPTKANRAKIAEAYAIMAGRWPGTPGQMEIRGRVRTGDDDRNRGDNRSAPLRVNGRFGNWERMRAAWESGAIDDDDFEDWFIGDVIEMDIGEGSDEWEFPGSAYVITF